MREKWLWRGVAAAVYAAVFYIALSVFDDHFPSWDRDD
jgi:hypothetical protein